MTLRAIVDALAARDVLVAAPQSLPSITSVVDDSRRATPGSLFCAVTGTVADGHEYIGDAVSRGAVAAIVARPTTADIPVVLVREDRVAAAVAAATWYGRPAAALRLVGVTGTNGKSTTVSLTRHILNAAADVAALGTLGAVDGNGREVPEGSGLTTPGPVQLHATLAYLRDAGARTAVMEASSHALHQRRTAELVFRGVIYTNLTHDHLDYHGDPDAYRKAKLRLSEHLASDGVEVTNADDPAWAALPRRGGIRRVTYAITAPADVRATAIELTAAGSRFTLTFANRAGSARLPLLGEFNVSNALAAAALAWGFGLEPEAIVERLAVAPQVPGRMERLVSDRYTVLRDYAHTPDALGRAIRALRPVTEGRLVVLFGCGGDRDRAKRAVMGEIAGREADLAIVTSDNPRTESPERIIDDIERGMGDVAHVRIADRREAIGHALTMLAPGDCLLLAGKGHETYQVIGTDRFPFDERAIVRDALGMPAA